jgi:hypothetical protein
MKILLASRITSLIIIFLFTINTLAQPIFAADPNADPKIPGGVNAINIGQNLPKTNMGVPADPGIGIIGTVLKNTISLFFIIGGLATLIYFVWGAVDWIMSGGDKEKVSGARKKMTNAVIGLVLLSLSYFLVGLVGEIVGFNPLGPFDIKSLGEK